jgi:hypothetical protein
MAGIKEENRYAFDQARPSVEALIPESGINW